MEQFAFAQGRSVVPTWLKEILLSADDSDNLLPAGLFVETATVTALEHRFVDERPLKPLQLFNAKRCRCYALLLSEVDVAALYPLQPTRATT